MGIDISIRIGIMAAMGKTMYQTVLDLLEARKGEWKRISDDSRVPYSTLCKIAQRHIESPSVHTVQALYNALTSEHAA